MNFMIHILALLAIVTPVIRASEVVAIEGGIIREPRLNCTKRGVPITDEECGRILDTNGSGLLRCNPNVAAVSGFICYRLTNFKYKNIHIHGVFGILGPSISHTTYPSRRRTHLQPSIPEIEDDFYEDEELDQFPEMSLDGNMHNLRKRGLSKTMSIDQLLRDDEVKSTLDPLSDALIALITETKMHIADNFVSITKSRMYIDITGDDLVTIDPRRLHIYNIEEDEPALNAWESVVDFFSDVGSNIYNGIQMILPQYEIVSNVKRSKFFDKNIRQPHILDTLGFATVELDNGYNFKCTRPEGIKYACSGESKNLNQTGDNMLMIEINFKTGVASHKDITLTIMENTRAWYVENEDFIRFLADEIYLKPSSGKKIDSQHRYSKCENLDTLPLIIRSQYDFNMHEIISLKSRNQLPSYDFENYDVERDIEEYEFTEIVDFEMFVSSDADSSIASVHNDLNYDDIYDKYVKPYEYEVTGFDEVPGVPKFPIIKRDDDDDSDSANKKRTSRQRKQASVKNEGSKSQVECLFALNNFFKAHMTLLDFERISISEDERVTKEDMRTLDMLLKETRDTHILEVRPDDKSLPSEQVNVLKANDYSMNIKENFLLEHVERYVDDHNKNILGTGIIENDEIDRGCGIILDPAKGQFSVLSKEGYHYTFLDILHLHDEGYDVKEDSIRQMEMAKALNIAYAYKIATIATAVVKLHYAAVYEVIEDTFKFADANQLDIPLVALPFPEKRRRGLTFVAPNDYEVKCGKKLNPRDGEDIECEMERTSKQMEERVRENAVRRYTMVKEHMRLVESRTLLENVGLARNPMIKSHVEPLKPRGEVRF